MLDWLPNPNDPEVFHITHVDNLPSIVAGGLHADAKVAAGLVDPVVIGAASIKLRRLTWRLNLFPTRPVVGDFVPFYFCPRSEMLYRIHRGHASWTAGQGAIVHLVSRVSRLVPLARQIIFTDANAATAYHYASVDLSELPTRIDWTAMRLTQWAAIANAAAPLVQVDRTWYY